jgi:small GTP-binding protein
MNAGEFKFKFVMLGDFAVGKTSLVKRFVYNIFDDLYLTTIGVRVMKKELAINDRGEIQVTLLIWDIGGQQDFQMVTPQYLQGASGAIIVADQSRIQTIEQIDSHIEQFWNENPPGKIVIAFNKDDMFSDAEPPGEVKSHIESKHERHGDAVFRTSAKDGRNVQEMFVHLVGSIMNRKPQ